MNTQPSIDDLKFLGISVFNAKSFGDLLLRFTFNFIIVFIIIRLLYYPNTKRKDFLFTYILISTIVFFLCSLLGNVKLQLGFSLGLFAVFGIIRYRTDPMPIREMTYLFVTIGISVINALTNKKVSYVELLFTNFILVGIIFGLEKLWLLKHENFREIKYDHIELIKPEKHDELLNDLETRTGLKINRIEIGEIDFLRDTAQIKIFYYSKEWNSSSYSSDDDDDD